MGASTDAADRGAGSEEAAAMSRVWRGDDRYPWSVDDDDEFEEWPTGYFWAALFVLFGVVILWNPPPVGAARFYLVGSAAVLVGVGVLVVTWIRGVRR
jgi:hypothetical protein